MENGIWNTGFNFLMNVKCWVLNPSGHKNTRDEKCLFWEALKGEENHMSVEHHKNGKVSKVNITSFFYPQGAYEFSLKYFFFFTNIN